MQRRTRARRIVAAISVVATSLTLGPTSARSSDVGAQAAGPGTGIAHGYWLVATDGGIFSYDTPFHGSMGGRHLNKPMIGMAPTPKGNGYWTVATDGGIFTFGDAPFHGSTGGAPLNRPIVGMAPTNTGGGYWLVASDGGIFTFGDALFFGSLGGAPHSQPIVGMVPTGTGYGYWLVSSDGRVFTFGDARWHGDAGGIRLSSHVVGMASSPSGLGYWLVGADGAVYSYGDAVFYGSTAGVNVGGQVVGITPTPRGNGYWIATSNGGVFTFGEAPYSGSANHLPLNQPVVGMAARPVRYPAEVSIFYYPWYETPPGPWRHWTGYGHETPPADIPADFYPERGVYNSGDPDTVDAHMTEMARSGINVVVASWWGRGTYEDSVLPVVVDSARRHGLRVAAHIEPYAGRSPGSVGDDLARLSRLGINEAYVYDGMGPPVGDWLGVAKRFPGMRLWMETSRFADVLDGDFAWYARQSGFDGIYTYNPIRYNREQLVPACGHAHRFRLLCAPAISPGHATQRTFPRRTQVGRGGGRRYDASWLDAIAADADTVAITSYNEWHEGTQIEPAMPWCFPDGFCTSGYEGDYGATGLAARRVYLDRTAGWAGWFRAQRP
ncbi:MAG TPA: hypothetical protein VM938_01185 [Acidimicrobiales bacterium]|nr:hypothetical protein [Acidimicrobiales bacterium]